MSNQKNAAPSSEVAKLFAQVDSEICERESNKNLRSEPASEDLGREHGRLDRFYADYLAAMTAHQNVENAERRLLEELERYGRKICYCRTQNSTLIDEAVQTALIKVWFNISHFRHRSLFSTWCCQIVRNALEDVRHEQDRGGITDSPKTLDEDFPETPLDSRDLSRLEARVEWLDSVLKSLPPLDRRIIDLFRAGYSNREIGELAGRNAKWAANQLSKIKTKLKKLAANQPDLAKSVSSCLMMGGKEGNPKDPFPASQAAD